MVMGLYQDSWKNSRSQCTKAKKKCEKSIANTLFDKKYPLIGYRFFFEFLLANERHVAKEVRDEYVDTMSKVYYSYFKGYIGRLMKLQVCHSTSIDLLKK